MSDSDMVEEREIAIVKRENGRVKQLLKDRGRELDAKNKTIEELQAKIKRLEDGVAKVVEREPTLTLTPTPMTTVRPETVEERSFYKTNRSGD